VKWLRSVLMVALALGFASVALAAPASAHAGLLQATPAPGSTVDLSPTLVSLQFSEPVGLNSRSIQVTDSAGRRVDRGVPHVLEGVADTVAVDLRTGLARGSYTVVWRVVSADAHPVSGTFSFGYGVPAGTAAAVVAGDPVVPVLHGLGRGAALASAVVLLGVPFFVIVVWPAGSGRPALRRLTRIAWVTAVAAAVWLFVLQGPYGAGLGVGAVLDPELWGLTLSGQFGKLLLLRLVALASAWPVLDRLTTAERRPTGSRADDFTVPLAALGVLFVVSFSYSEHGGAPPWQPFGGLADMAHLAAAGLWLGGLVTLAVVLAPGAAEPRGLAEALPRWSRVAMACVAVLVATGLVQAWRQTLETAAVTGTDYGRLVLVKAGLLVVLVVVAASSRRLVAGLRLGPAGGSGALRTRVGVELVLGAVVLVVTAVLVNTVPARESYTAPFSATLTARDTQGRTATVLVDLPSTRAGSAIVHLYTFDDKGAVLPFSIVTATLVEPTKKLGPVSLSFSNVARGHAQTTVVVPATGTWTLTVQVITDGVTDYSASTQVEVR